MDEGKGTWQYKDNMIGRTLTHPLRATHRVGAERKGEGGLPGPRAVREARQYDTRRTLPCTAELARSCARMFGKLWKPTLALKEP